MSLEMNYLGLTLKNPIVIAASPLSQNLEGIKKAEDAGAGAVCLASLFEEQINYEQEELDYFLHFGTDSFAEALSYFPSIDQYVFKGVENYLKLISEAKESVDLPIIPSLNGVSTGGWIEYAKEFEKAGASALELNLYYIPTDSSLAAGQVEQMYLDTVKAVRETVKIPIALKIGPFFTAFSNFASQAVAAGANGLVLFNRFYGPDIDLESFEVTSSLHLSQQQEMQLALRWIALLNKNIKADLSATSGIHSAADVIKMVLAGASSCQMASVFLKRGVGYISTMLDEMSHWLSQNEFESLAELRGRLCYQSVSHPAAYERANYMKALSSYEHAVD